MMGTRCDGEPQPPPGLRLTWGSLAAELVASWLLVALCCLVPCVAPGAPLLHRALATGLVVTTLVQVRNAVSTLRRAGHPLRFTYILERAQAAF
jgi:hypothetical protein